MRLLVITQKVNKNDPGLGFFHEWLLRLAGQVEKLTVICLEKGEYTLPNNVTVLSLGKENSVSRLKCLINFYKYIWQERHNYDGVFVHMNPEYCILGGLFWRIWHKKILFWYMHKAVNLRLWLAEKFVNKIFTASKESFRLPSKKVEVVGHGIPVEQFAVQLFSPPAGQICLLSVGRITPSKDLAQIIRALVEVKKNANLAHVKLDIIGAPITELDKQYVKELYSLALSLKQELNIYAVAPRDLLEVYQHHHLFIHTSRTGSMDKVVLEALSSGRWVITSSEAYSNLAKEGLVYDFPSGNYLELAKTIEKVCQSGILDFQFGQLVPNQKGIDYVQKNHNLNTVIGKISHFFAS